MKKRSSAYKVQYDLRPAKQTERRILIDILKLGSECGLNISGYKYLGFGGFKFYDFEMLFRHLGIRDMTSVEMDETIFPRCVYNVPFGFIDPNLETLAAYLERSNFRKPVVAWLDYDCTLSKDVLDDLLTIGGKAPIGSFDFATIDARLPDAWARVNPANRIAILKQELEGFALNPTIADVQPVQFHGYAEKVLWAALKAALSKRTDGRFVPLVRLFYKDTTLMITVGGLLCPFKIVEEFERKFRTQFRFLSKADTPFTVPGFNFTMRERHVLDSIVTSKTSQKRLRQTMKKIGLTRDVVEDYKRMVRFLPKYFESYL